MSEFTPPEVDNDSDTDFEIDAVDGSARKIYYALNSKLRVYQYHYNTSKVKNKLVAMTWIISSFIGFGYLLSGEEVSLPLSNLITISLLSYLSAIGLLLIWFLDVVVYHRLIESIFTEQLLIEESYPELTFTHHYMAKLLASKKNNPVIYDAMFYTCFIFIFLMISNVSISLNLYEKEFRFVNLFFASVLVASIALSWLLIKISVKSGFYYLYKK